MELFMNGPLTRSTEHRDDEECAIYAIIISLAGYRGAIHSEYTNNTTLRTWNSYYSGWYRLLNDNSP